VQVRVSEELRPILRLGWVEYAALGTPAEAPGILEEMEAVASAFRGRWGERPISEMEEVRRTRNLYKALGLDPTRHRPSSEALLRRAVKGKPLPRVNGVVDAVNTASLLYQVSMGLYDADAVEGKEVQVRVGGEGEGYEGIGRGRINVSGRICLSDEEGPFGNPTADSDRTKVTLETTRVFVATFHPADTAEEAVRRVLDKVTRLVLEAGGGSLVESRIL